MIEKLSQEDLANSNIIFGVDINQLQKTEYSKTSSFESIREWIRYFLPLKGDSWCYANMEQCSIDCSKTINPLTFIRSIQIVKAEFRNKPLPSEPSDVVTVDDALTYHEVDMTSMKIDKVKVNTWGHGKITNKQVTVTLTPRQIEINSSKVIENFKKELVNYERKPFIIERVTERKNTEKFMLEIAVPDIHHGLLSWKEESGADYDIKISEKRIKETVKRIMDLAADYPLEKILFLLNGDIFNSDNMHSTTTAGTKQSDDTRFQKTFSTGWKIIRDVIEYCKEFANVHLVITQGNHDFANSFMLGEVLAAWFNNDDQVIVDNSPAYYKYFQYGKSLIGITHGDGAKIEQLPLLMATDVPKMWAETEHREIHIGHLHASATRGFQMETSRPGCKVVVCPAISSASDWTRRMGYRSIPEAQAFLWGQKRGRIASFYYRPED